MKTTLPLLSILSLIVSCQLHKSVENADLRSLGASVSYSVRINSIPTGASSVRVWVPLPRSSTFQDIHNLRFDPKDADITVDPLYRNKLLYLEYRNQDSTSLEVSLSYDLVRREEVARREATNHSLLERYLEPDRLGTIDDRVRKAALKATAGKAGSMAKARGIYDHVLAHMEYDKLVPGWGRGDTTRACEVGKGNCSDYHALFISMARAVRIPARFHYGLALKPEGLTGTHCWAAFHDEENGWVPVDISEADKNPERTDYYFGRLSENRILLSTGRDIILAPPQQGEPLNFLIHPYVEVDGKPHTHVEARATYSRELPAALPL